MHLHWRGEIERNLLAVLFPPDNEIPIFEGGYRVGEPEPDGQWTVPDPDFADRADPVIGRPFDFEYRSRPELCPQRLPGTMLFGNSFSDYYWALGLAALLLFHSPRTQPDQPVCKHFTRQCQPKPNISFFNITNPGWFSILRR